MNFISYFQEITKEHLTILTRVVVLVYLVFVVVSCDSVDTTVKKTPPKLEFVDQVLPKDSVQLVPEKGLVFYHDIPYTGRTIEKYDNGIVASSIDYVNGKKHGFFKKWFGTGLLSFEAEYHIGKRDGSVKTWWKNGNIRSESFFEDGITEGYQTEWYKSGAIFKRAHLVGGRESGLQQSWRENGKLYNNYEAKNGRIFGMKRASLCFALEDEEIQI